MIYGNMMIYNVVYELTLLFKGIFSVRFGMKVLLLFVVVCDYMWWFAVVFCYGVLFWGELEVES